MDPNKKWLQYGLRQLRLLQLSDDVRFFLRRVSTAARNRRFSHEYPGFSLPPPYLSFDAYGHIDYFRYYQAGRKFAERLINIIDTYTDYSTFNVFEWGCGPARVIRHLPALLQNRARMIVGSDYNQATIRWCQQHIPGIIFLLNGLHPPLAIQDQQFEVVYAISVLTHLSEEACHAWVQELRRITYPGGIILVTLKGDSYLPIMLPHERRCYRTEGIVMRGAIQEGKKWYGTFHHPTYVRRNLFREFEELRHEEPETSQPSQDLWVFRKPHSIA